jgi:hypothetical protein
LVLVLDLPRHELVAVLSSAFAPGVPSSFTASSSWLLALSRLMAPPPDFARLGRTLAAVGATSSTSALAASLRFRFLMVPLGFKRVAALGDAFSFSGGDDVTTTRGAFGDIRLAHFGRFPFLFATTTTAVGGDAVVIVFVVVLPANGMLYSMVSMRVTREEADAGFAALSFVSCDVSSTASAAITVGGVSPLGEESMSPISTAISTD